MKTLFLILSVCFIVNPSFAQQKKLALVIGNSAYQHGGVLKNPVNDAKLMTSTLKDLGFTVISHTDASKTNMDRAIYEFSKKLSDYDVALFYYAGHGVQIDGINYLLPIDAELKDKLSAEFEAVDVSKVVRQFEKNHVKTNIVILDACRNNPFRSWSRGGDRGFKAIPAPSGTIIAFATGEGATAADGDGANGLYTSMLVKQMKIPQRIEDVFIQTRVEVQKASKNQQSPQEWSQLTSKFFFKEESTSSSTNKTNIVSPVLGNSETIITYGSINLIAEIEGDLYLDGKNLGFVKANTKVPINKVTTGTHTLKIGSWEKTISIKENDMISVTAKEVINKAAIQNWIEKGKQYDDNYNYKQALYWYQKAAEKGNVSAQYEVANIFYWNKGVEKDYKKAMFWYQKAAEQGHGSAQRFLGGMYRYGYGVDKDKDKENYWYKKAYEELKKEAEQGDPVAQRFLGDIYQYSEGVKGDYKDFLYWNQKAREGLKKKAEKGDAISQYNLGKNYRAGFGFEMSERDDKKAVVWYQKAAEQRLAVAQYNLGWMYMMGKGIKKDYYKALEWYRRAADQGNLAAQKQIGWAYFKGQGVERDFEKTIYWVEKAAGEGFEEAQEKLGWLYRFGIKDKRDYKKSFYWYQKAAEQGNLSAQYVLGNMYYKGEGVEKSYKKAFEWHKNAAELGNTNAENSLGDKYHKGEGVEKDDQKAVFWYQKAADKSFSWAQFNLAVMYQNGWGVAKDDEKAFFWCKRAAGSHHPEAQLNLGMMYNKGQGIEKDKEKAIDWFKKAAKARDRTIKENAKKALKELGVEGY